MSSQSSLPLPNDKVPGLKFPIAGGDTFDLAVSQPENFSMLVFYRGLHCRYARVT